MTVPFKELHGTVPCEEVADVAHAGRQRVDEDRRVRVAGAEVDELRV